MLTSSGYLAKAESEPQDSTNNQTNNENYCQNVNNVNNTLNNNLDKRISELETVSQQKKKIISKDFDERKRKIIQTRNVWDDNREQQLLQLKKRYNNNNEKKRAIDDFSKQVDNAISQRRAKTDEVLKNYNTRMQQQLVNNKLADSAKQFRHKIQLSENEALESCKNSDKPSNVRTQFISNFLQARNEMVGDQKGVSYFNKQVSISSAELEQELDKIKEDFKSKIQTASNQLNQKLK